MERAINLILCLAIVWPRNRRRERMEEVGVDDEGSSDAIHI